MSDAENREAARVFAQWEIGDPSWADEIINIYLSKQPREDVQFHCDLTDEEYEELI